MSVATKPAQRPRRRRRVRAKVRGTAERPRISVFRSLRGIQAQAIDDEKGHTIASVTWTEKDLNQLKRTRPEKSRGGKQAPEPYKGKGIRYEGEYVARKVGKRA